MENDQDEVPTASTTVWILLILTAAVSFWCQAVVTEERFVPALNILSTAYNIPDDIAGATLMAAGASSPELFSSIVALFITHSSLGLGTIVGSEIFNQLVICAGAVFASKSGKLVLDRSIVLREVFFYALGIALLFIALQDTRPVAYDNVDHIFISFADACMVFAGYIAYVLVCANMDAVVNFISALFGSRKKGRSETSLLSASNGTTAYESISHVTQSAIKVENLPFLHQKSLLDETPKENFDTVTLSQTKTGEQIGKQQAQALTTRAHSSFMDGATERPRASLVGTTFRQIARFSDGSTLRNFEYSMMADKPSYHHGLYDMEVNSFEERLSCFLWQRSYFYTKARFATHGWHLRWFTFTANKMYSVPNRIHFEKHKISYPFFNEVTIDSERLIIEITPEEGEHPFTFLCPSQDIFDHVVKKMSDIITYNQQGKEDGMQPEHSEARPGEEFEHELEASLIEFPSDGSNADILLFLVLFPLRWLMHLTVPDVRTVDRHGNPMGTLRNAWISIIMCLAWLVVGSYAMVASLESLATLMDIPDAVVGVTVSAAGTSLPNYVASAVAARSGFGNMAVSNAFGSNTFNIMIGLGLPWVLYTSLGNHFEPYSGLRNEGIVQSVIIMGTVLLLFIVFMIPTGFVLHAWHGYVFILCYVAYLAFAIGQVYIH